MKKLKASLAIAGTAALVLVGSLLGAAPAQAGSLVTNSLTNVGELSVGAKTASSGTVIPLASGSMYLNITAVSLAPGQCAEVGLAGTLPSEFCAGKKSTLLVPLAKGNWEVNRTK